jgi:hypothetical protein
MTYTVNDAVEKKATLNPIPVGIDTAVPLSKNFYMVG